MGVKMEGEKKVEVKILACSSQAKRSILGRGSLRPGMDGSAQLLPGYVPESVGQGSLWLGADWLACQRLDTASREQSVNFVPLASDKGHV
jgi:hypothetical protein